MDAIKQFQKIFEKNKCKRIVVIGTTCTGKTTFVKKIKNAKDMDDLIFPLLSKEEEKYICSDPWTKEIGKTMTRLVKERIKVEKGTPLFGTVLLECDLIIYLEINDNLLKERCSKRKADFKNAKNMQKMILEEIKESQVPSMEIKIN
jgi:dephospho-CoA kinase